MPGIVIQIQGDGANATAALEAIREEMARTREEAHESAGEMAEFGERIKRALEFTGIYLGFEELREGLKELVVGSMELGEQMEHLSAQTGISAANLSVLKYAADSNGISFETMTTGFRKLSEEMLKANTGEKTAAAAFERIGISQGQLKEHSNDLWGTLNLLADRFQSLPDGAIKNAEATELLGRAGQQLIPILNQGSEGLESFRAKAESLGVVLDEDGIAKMAEMHRALVDMQAAAEGAGLQFTEGISPAVVGFASAMKSATGSMSGFETAGETVSKVLIPIEAAALELQQSFRDMADGVEIAYGAIMKVAGALVGFIPIAKDAATAISASGSSAIQDGIKHFKDEQKNLEAATAELKKVFDDIGKKQGQKESSGDAGGGSFDMGAGQKEKRPKGDDNIARASTALAEGMAQAQVAAIKAGTAEQLAALEDQHKQFLVSDAAYYTDKLKLQDQAFDAEIAALKTRTAELAALEERQKSDRTLKRDKSGQSAEELNTARQLLEVQSKIAEVEGQKAKAAAEYKLNEAQATNAGQLEILKQAAQIEQERNQGISARLALLRYENELELQKASVNYGASSPQYQQVQQLGQIAEAKLQIQQMDEQIAESEKQESTQVKEIQDAVQRGLVSKKAAQQEINALNQAEAALLREILPMYQQEANYLGGGAKDKSQDIQKQIGDLSAPTRKQGGDLGGQVADSLSKSVTSSLEQLATSANKGKVNFTAMADSMISDIERIALKSLEEQAISPFFNNLFGGGGSGGSGGSGGGFLSSIFSSLSGHAKGGPMDGPSWVGEEGPEIFAPDTPGNVISNDTLKSMASNGGGGAPNVSFTVVNNSSANVSAKETGRSYDHDSKQFIVHTVLEDLQGGGSLAGAFGGMNRS